MSIFRELLSIKSFRESKAELAVHKQRRALAEATEQRDGARSELTEYRNFALARERSLFGELCARVVKLRDIEDVQVEVVVMRGRERDREKKLDDAESHRETQSGELQVRKTAHVEASRMKEKFVELAQVYADEQIRELERKEDAELEEAAEIRRDRVDWDERAEDEVAG
ncbi:MAG: YscO family type III secretion system apparatus protein [Ramlibacter sp.]